MMLTANVADGPVPDDGLTADTTGGAVSEKCVMKPL
jgi:hypothetical protein